MWDEIAVAREFEDREQRTLRAARAALRWGRWRLLPAALAVAWFAPFPSGEASAQHVLWSQEGANANDQFGTAVAAGSDYDGDGRPDVLLAAVRSGSSSRGSLEVRSGRTGALIYAYAGEADGDDFGLWEADVGDFDGDGKSDFAVGAPLHNGKTGKLYVYSGKDGGLILGLDGEGAGDFFGFRVVGIGDANGDGIGDVLVSSPQRQGLQGRVYLLAGPSGAVIATMDGDTGNDQFGIHLAGCNDFDGDGKRELVIGSLHDAGAGFQSGRLYVYSGATRALLHAFNGEAGGDQFSRELNQRAGDANGDGVDDLLTTAGLHGGPNGAGSGKAYLYSGKTFALLGALDGAAAGDGFGAGADFLPDQDGDGCAELSIGGNNADGGAGAKSGRWTLWSGRTLRQFTSFGGEHAGDEFSCSSAAVGDVNGDKIADLVVGARGFDGAAGADSGKTYVIAGNDLFFDVSPKTAQGGDTVTLTTTGGKPGNFVIDAITNADGFPLFLVIGVVFTFDSNGELVLAGDVPPGLGSHDLELKSFAIGRRGKLVDSDTEQLLLR